MGCRTKDCTLCKNNPHKRCAPDDNFDECFADNQALKAKCESEVYVELINQSTGKPAAIAGVEVQVRSTQRWCLGPHAQARAFSAITNRRPGSPA